MKANQGACKVCKVIFGSKSIAFEMKTAVCPYCKTSLHTVRKGCKYPIRWVSPPAILSHGGKTTRRMVVEENIFGKLASTTISKTTAAKKKRRLG